MTGTSFTDGIPRARGLWSTAIPQGRNFTSRGQTQYVIGYNEEGGVLVSRFDPNQDYDSAVTEF